VPAQAPAAPLVFFEPPRVAPLAATEPVADEPAVERRSRGAMIGGVIMVSIGPIALLGALSAKNAQEDCDQRLENDYPSHRLPSSERYRKDACDSYSAPLYVLGIGGALLTLGGVPLIIYGAKNVPKPRPSASLQLAPWATPRAGGLKLRLDL
jgi:hypothetical protein